MSYVHTPIDWSEYERFTEERLAPAGHVYLIDQPEYTRDISDTEYRALVNRILQINEE